MALDPSFRRLISQFRNAAAWDQDLEAHLLRSVWPLLVGERLAGVTSVTGVSGSTLILNVPDLNWRRELFRTKHQILKNIKAAWPSSGIKDILFTYEDHHQ